MRWLFALLLAALVVACDDPNRHPRNPMPAPESSPSSTDGSMDAGTSPDGGPSTAPVPTIQPQPGDIQL